MEQIAQKSTMQNLEQRDPKAAERGDRPTRRRSHRPRGCRGGSNRRKNKGGENRSSFNKSKRTMGKKQDSFKNQRSSFNKGSNASEGLLTNTATTKMGQQPGGYEYDQTLSLQEFGAPRGDMMYSSGYNSSSSDLYPSGTDLQESLSESSEESGGSYANPRSFHSDSRDMGLILPPMAMNNSRETEPMSFRGPNPYALHPTTNHKISDPRLPVYGMYNNANAQGPEAHKMNPQFYNNGNVYSENATYGLLATLHLPGLESKMNHVTKQPAHRPVRGGGSLFCTSPRSFLMGNKKNDFVTRSE